MKRPAGVGPVPRKNPQSVAQPTPPSTSQSTPPPTPAAGSSSSPDSAPAARPMVRPGTSAPADQAETLDLSDLRLPAATDAPVNIGDDDATQDLSEVRPGRRAASSAARSGNPTSDGRDDGADGDDEGEDSSGASGSGLSGRFRRAGRSFGLRRRSVPLDADARDEAADALAAALAAAETAAADRSAWIEDITPASAPSDYRKARRARRRTERAEMRRFTETGRRRRRNGLIAGAAVAGVALIAAALAFTPIMSVRTIEVIGTDRVNGEDLAHDLNGQQGQPFPFVDESAIKAVLTTYPLIESYSVESRPPSTLLVTIVERTPLGVVKTGSGYDLVDAAGVVIETTKAPPEGYPLIDIRREELPKAFAAAGAVLRSVPADLLPRITSITATTRDNVTFALADSKATVLWGDATEGTLKAALLDALMTAKPDAKRYDVTSTEIGVVG